MTVALTASRISLAMIVSGFVAAMPAASCSTDSAKPPPGDADAADATIVRDARPTTGTDASATVSPDAMPPGAYCALPGSVVSTAQGMAVVPGGDASAPDLGWLTVPPGFCAHYFATVPETRQLRFSPGGDLFLASPSAATTGGASGGLGKILVLPDDDHDGVADSTLTFFDKTVLTTGMTQGMTFAQGYFYVQDNTNISRVAFQPHDRKPSSVKPELVTTITAPQAQEHWPKVLDMDTSGNLYISNGSSQSALCYSPSSPLALMQYDGAIFQLTGNGSTTTVAQGFRNPIAMRCESNHDVCLVAELAKDGSGDQGGREKLVPIRQGDNWGYPCCAAKNIPYGGVEYQDTGSINIDCSDVTAESVSFEIGHTPFGLDFETGAWPAPWTGRVFVTLHGDVGTWYGARVVAIALDPATGLPLPADEADGSAANAANLEDFATGWDDGKQDHGRPAAVTFAPDGRMFIGDDMNGVVFWVAPITLLRPGTAAN
jgi:glucose/arabinose dehydrogenase